MPIGGTISDFGGQFEDFIRGVNESREALSALQGEVSNVARSARQNADTISAVINVLTENMSKMQNEASNIATALNGISSALTRNRPHIEQHAATLEDMWEVYKKMGVEVDELNLNLKTLKFTQSEMNKVVKLGTDYNKERETSYAALAEKYKAIKILLDNMTVSEIQSTKEGMKLLETARGIYQQMNMFQQSTGKYQLQVGDYSKAMTGLNIATNQLVREIPVLANGVSMFAIAISNNIPIWMESIKAMKADIATRQAQKQKMMEEAAELEALSMVEEAAAKRTEANAIKVTSVGKALVQTLISWQTIMVVVLAVLPGLIKKIQEKKKAQQEANSATKEAIEYEKLLEKAYADTGKEQVRSVTRLQTLYYITQDTLRSQEDRIKAARIMKEEYKEEFANLSEEQILLGQAKQAYDELTNSLLEQAKARAYMNKITELYEQMIDQTIIKDQRKVELDNVKVQKASIDAEIERQKALGKTADQYQDLLMLQGILQSDYDKAYSNYMQADMPLQDIDNAILKLREDIPVDGLLSEMLHGRGRKGRAEGGVNITDYFFEMLQAQAEALPFELDRQLAIRETAWLKEKDSLTKHVADLSDMLDKADADERAQIQQQIEYLLKLLWMGQDKYDADMKQIIRDRVNSYAEAVVEDTVAEDIPSQIEKRMRRGRKYGGIVEAILAQTKKYGEGNKFGQGILQEQYVNFVTSVDQALKTSIGFMDEWMDKRLEMAKIAVEAAEKEVQAAQKVLDFEMEARANGYANRVETARKELDLEREQHRKALEEQKRLQEQQLLFDSISQTSSLITATANIWEAMTKGTGLLGPALAVAATALMWGSFAASKIKAKQLAQLQSEQYGEGTVELLEGGSHASGHDIDLGTKKDGTRRRAEGGEFFAVINKRNSRKYRGIIPDVINSFNDGTFGERYQRANQAMGNFALGLLAGGSPTDVSALERDVRAIREQGDEHRYMDSMGNTVIRYKNITRKITTR